MALAKRPKLLLLDEPVAALDPLARVESLTSLAQAAADEEGGLTVVMSSHLLSDLERVCDHVIILAAGKTQLCDNIEQVLKTHKLLVGPPGKLPPSNDFTVVKEAQSSSVAHVLVRLNDAKLDIRGWDVRDVDIEEIVLSYMGQSREKASNKGDER